MTSLSPATLLRRLRSRKISLSAAPFYASLVVILALAIFIGIFWAINEYQAHQESIENIRTTYQEQYQDRVREELENVIDFIDYTRNQADINAEEEIRNRVQSAYTIASHLFSMYKDEKPVAEIRAMVVEVLRPIRWFGERGYYFAGRTTDGLIDLFADEPSFEGKSRLHPGRNHRFWPGGFLSYLQTVRPSIATNIFSVFVHLFQSIAFNVKYCFKKYYLEITLVVPGLRGNKIQAG